MSDIYLSLDQGTTSTRAILYTEQGEKLAEESALIHSDFPHTGWVEQSPIEILKSVESVLKQVVEKANISPKSIKAMGITNQRETTVLWDKTTGEAIYPAIVWQDRRTAPFCENEGKEHAPPDLHEKTGLVLDPYFSATKIAWVLENVPHSQSLLKANQLAFGTIDSFLLWHLTDNKCHTTDITNASRTLLFNIKTHQWDEALLNFFKVPQQILPEVKPCCYEFGHLAKRFLGVEIPILAMIGDQQSASVGQGCIHPEQIKATYGTGCFMLLNTGNECVYSNNQLLTTIAYQINDKTTYALEGSIFIAGALIKWLRNSLNLFDSDSQIEALIAKSNQKSEALFIPALSGLGAPHWAPHAKGALFGLTQDTSIADILRAALEGVCFQTRDLIESLKHDYPHSLKEMKVDGGMVNNQVFLQMLANFLNMNIMKSSCVEATAFGAFLLAALQHGAFSNLENAVQLCQSQAAVNPDDTFNQAEHQYQNWLEHIEKIRA